MGPALPVLEDETLDELFGGKIRVLQKRDGYRLSMDPVLLAHFISPLRGGRVMDLGTGSGVIPLILARRGDAGEVVGVEIDAALVDMAKRSARLNGLEESIRFVRGDFRRIHELFAAESFQHVVSNPPYHPAGRGRESPAARRSIAKHELAGSLRDVVRAAAYLLGTKGRLWLTYPPERLAHLFHVAEQCGFGIKRVRMVHGRSDIPARMALVEALRGGKEGLTVLPPLILYARGNQYSEELERIYRMI